MRYVAPGHILELTLEVILDHKIGIKDHDCGDGRMSEGQTTHRISRTSHFVLREAGTTMGLPRWFS